jgi:hypothetical protein
MGLRRPRESSLKDVKVSQQFRDDAVGSQLIPPACRHAPPQILDSATQAHSAPRADRDSEKKDQARSMPGTRLKIGRILHLRSEIRASTLNLHRGTAQSAISDFGLELQDSSDLEIPGQELVNLRSFIDSRMHRPTPRHRLQRLNLLLKILKWPALLFGDGYGVPLHTLAVLNKKRFQLPKSNPGAVEELSHLPAAHNRQITATQHAIETGKYPVDPILVRLDEFFHGFNPLAVEAS